MAEKLSPQERGKLGAEKRWKEQQAAAGDPVGEIPKYRITPVCYGADDKIYDPEAQPRDDDGNPKPLYMEFIGQPAWYMEPANDAARKVCKETPPAPWNDLLVMATRLSTDHAPA